MKVMNFFILYTFTTHDGCALMINDVEDDDDDGDGIADIHDNDDDGDGLDDDDGEATSPKKAAKTQSGSGPWSTIVFGYFFGLTHYILKTA